MGSSPWLTLRVTSRAAIFLLFFALQQNQIHDQSLQLPQFLAALGDDPEGSVPDDGSSIETKSGNGSSVVLDDGDTGNEDVGNGEAVPGVFEQDDVSPQMVAQLDGVDDSVLPSEHAAPLPSERGTPTSEVKDWLIQTGTAEAEAQEPSGDGSASTLPAEQTKIGDLTEDKEESVAAERSQQFDLQTARQLVEAVEEAAEVAGGAVTAVETILKDVLVHKQECEARSRAIGEKIYASSTRLQQLALDVSDASNAVVEMRDAELAKFREAVTDIKQSQEWSAIAQRQQTVMEIITALKKEQETAARDLQMLRSSYLSLEGDIQEQLKKVLASADEASANSYKLLSERFRELSEAKVAEIQQAYNSHRLDELAIDRAILDMISQLKKKGVAILDLSDLFPDYSFEAVRKELMVRVAKRVKAFFLPVFIVTQTQEELSDWLYTRFHMVPSMRMLENIIDELSFVNDREAYAVVRVESVVTDVIIRRAEPSIETAAMGDSDRSVSAALKDVEEKQKLQLQSLTPGTILPFVLQPSQESLVMARGPFFGAEVVKRFDPLTKTYLRATVGGHLSRRAVLVVYMGDRKGEIARPTPSPQEVLRKLDAAEKLCNSFSPPLQEVAALWRQMEAEIPFYSIFFRADPVVFDTIPVSLSFEPAKLPPLPPSPLFRGEFGVVQIQVLCRGKACLIPSARALESAVSYVNSHSERGGVQALVTVVEEKITTFWRSKLRRDVEVTVRSADVPRLRLRLGASDEAGNSRGRGKALPEEGVVSLFGQKAVQQYLTQAVAKVILPSVGAHASFRRLLFHICVVDETC